MSAPLPFLNSARLKLAFVFASPATMSKSSKESFGQKTPIGRAGQPVEVATCFVFLASIDSSFMRCARSYPPLHYLCLLEIDKDV